MINTDIGQLDGDRWEQIIQSVFKRKYDTYQEMVASPGDLGIEGFVLEEGIVIQCYCPDEDYDTKTLYEKQRNKITKDLKKLDDNKDELVNYFGGTKIKQWIFITPRVAKHEIHAHARAKENVLQSYNLCFIDSECRVLVKDLGHYMEDIRKIQVVNGKQLSFSNNSGETILPPNMSNEYDKNITDKNKVRCYVNNEYREESHSRLNKLTKKQYLDGYEILRKIHIQSPEIYERIATLLNRFEDDVEEQSSTWEGNPQDLINYISEKLILRFEKDPHIAVVEYEDLTSIAKHMVSRWIAECPMRIV